MAYFWLQNKGV